MNLSVIGSLGPVVSTGDRANMLQLSVLFAGEATLRFGAKLSTFENASVEVVRIRHTNEMMNKIPRNTHIMVSNLSGFAVRFVIYN
jgi:hypothetical protein